MMYISYKTFLIKICLFISQNGGEHQIPEALIASELNGINGKTNPRNGMVIEMNQRNQVNGHSNGNALPGKQIFFFVKHLVQGFRTAVVAF